jgi:hypothetical protein
MAQQYIRTGNSGLQSADNFQVVSPSDSVDLAFQSRALYIGGAGDVSITNVSGVAIVFVGVPAGAILPVVTNRVRATGTTATNVIALY